MKRSIVSGSQKTMSEIISIFHGCMEWIDFPRDAEQ